MNRLLILCLLLPMTFASALPQSATRPTALDRYVAQKDSVYGWSWSLRSKAQA